MGSICFPLNRPRIDNHPTQPNERGLSYQISVYTLTLMSSPKHTAATLNRRAWLRRAGLGGALGLLGAAPGLRAAESFLSVPTAAPLVDGPIQLNANENPYGPSPKVRAAIQAAFDKFCRYPFRYSQTLQARLADELGVGAEQIVITGGSTEGLKLTGLTYGLHGGEVIAADPTFQSLLTYAELAGAYVHRVPVTEDLQHDLTAMTRRITSATRLIFLCNPNNPTGRLIDATSQRAFTLAAEDQAVVFIDEAYIDYVEDKDYVSGVELVKEGRNVIVSRTFSKIHGLAGMRIGYLVARPDIAERLRAHVMAFTSVPALVAAHAALDDEDFYRESVARNLEAKDHLYRAFDRMGLSYQRSHTNFVFFHTGRDISSLNAAMREQGVLVGRPFPPLNDWCRISTGTMAEMEVFVDRLEKVMMG